MKLKHLFSFLLIAALTLSFSSCGSSSLAGKAKKLEIGMTKKDAVNVMGKDYTTLAARQTPEGALETIRYENVEERPYIISFLNGKLVEWHIEKDRPHRPPHGNRPGRK